MKAQLYGQWIFNKARKNIQWEKDSLFHKCCWLNWTATCKRMKLDHILTWYTKINSKWIKDRNVRPDTIKVLQENTVRNLFDIIHSNFFLHMSSKARETIAKRKTKTNKQKNYWDFIKRKSFWTVKETINKTKRQPTEWEKTFAMTYLIKGSIQNLERTYSTEHPKTK